MYIWKANYHIKAFSLIELLIAMAIAAVLVALAVPSYRCLISSNRAQIYANELVALLEFAHTYAIKTGESVVFCRSKSNQSCDSLCQNGGCQDGMIVIVEDRAKVLKTLAPIDAGDSLLWSGTSKITFTSDGFASGHQKSFYYCPEHATNATVIILNKTGMARISAETHDGKKIPCVYNKLR